MPFISLSCLFLVLKDTFIADKSGGLRGFAKYDERKITEAKSLNTSRRTHINAHLFEIEEEC